jgi:DNA-directed RNA polymerase subunit K/omega
MTKKNKKNEESEDEMLEQIEENDNIDMNDEYEDDEDDDIIEELGDEETDTPDDCLIDKVIEEDNDFFDNIENSEVYNNKSIVQIPNNERISLNRLTKYEMVRILGERTKQLKMGAKPLIKNYETLSYEKIAEEELKSSMIPYKIKRHLPNGKYEIWSLDELYKDHLLSLLDE